MLEKQQMKDCSNFPIFEGLNKGQIEETLKSLKANTEVFPQQSIIVREGEKVSKIGLIVSGLAQIEKTDWNGNRNILFTIPENSMFGEALFCTGVETFHLTITASEDTTVLFIDGKKLMEDKSLPNRSEILANIMKIMARKNLVFREKLNILSGRTTREKLLLFLNSQASANGTFSFDISMDRQSLADYLGVERSALSAVISNLRNEGLIKCRKGHFELLQKERN